MSFTINFSLLNKAELEYEIKIRNGYFTTTTTVAELRKQILELSPDSPSEDILTSVFTPEGDIDAVRNSLFRVSNNIKVLKSKFGKYLFSKTDSILNHVFFRLSRIDIDSLADKKPLNLVWEEYHANHSSLSLLSKPVSDRMEPQNILEPSTDSFLCDRKLFAELSKFKFNGKTCVRSFIQRINEFMASRNIPETKILSFAFEIFSHDALHWYRAIKDSVASWVDLCQLLKRDFSSP